MVSFRFHIVSLTAVFLAIALGIGIGVTVIDKKVVDVKDAQVRRLTQQVSELRTKNDELSKSLDGWNRYDSDIDDRLLEGRLSGGTYVEVTESGMNSSASAKITGALDAAGARPVARMTLTDKWNSDKDVNELTAVVTVDAKNPKPEDIRKATFAALITDWQDPNQPNVLPELIKRGFISWKAEDPAATPEVFQLGDASIVSLLSNQSSVPVTNATLPFLNASATIFPKRIIAIATSDDQEKQGDATTQTTQAAIVVVRKDNGLDGKISTVDHGEELPGRTAMVLAIGQFGAGVVGDYGVGSSQVVPKATS